ncbi:hypothetical protein O181_006977 [Austropuccinia psidii MF-1]|uniref:Uncharacterized protein n=1 Tax=Austropuccinia psidii MF-1 TaxID=1389203 RepID=A0A9Q3GI19_9BASI|nr:hypothetical protein [Austropuccinia psidii MF-1]
MPYSLEYRIRPVSPQQDRVTRLHPQLVPSKKLMASFSCPLPPPPPTNTTTTTTIIVIVININIKININDLLNHPKHLIKGFIPIIVILKTTITCSIHQDDFIK